jgi:hypothetical protein
MKLRGILWGSAISLILSGLMWAFKLAPILIWVTFPGWLFAWGTLILLRAENWKYFGAALILLVTIGDAAFYSWIFLVVMKRKRKKLILQRESPR